MALHVSGYLLNKAVNGITADDLSVRLHSGDAGAAGTQNRIGNISATAAAASWTDGGAGALDDGVSEYTPDLGFGVLSNSASNTVRGYSLWDGANFMIAQDLAAAVVVAANESFVISGGTIEFDVNAAAAVMVEDPDDEAEEE